MGGEHWWEAGTSFLRGGIKQGLRGNIGGRVESNNFWRETLVGGRKHWCEVESNRFVEGTLVGGMEDTIDTEVGSKPLVRGWEHWWEVELNNFRGNIDGRCE